jgi:hypothetical protein
MKRLMESPSTRQFSQVLEDIRDRCETCGGTNWKEITDNRLK